MTAYVGYVRKSKEEVCKANCIQVQRVYESYLTLEDVGHLDTVFEEFLKAYGDRLFQEHGEINYVDEKV